MDVGGVGDDDEMDLEEQGPTKVVHDMVSDLTATHSVWAGFFGGDCLPWRNDCATETA
jgi:hypothetical protein